MSNDQIDDEQLKNQQKQEDQKEFLEFMQKFQDQPKIEDNLDHQSNKEYKIKYIFQNPNLNPYINEQNPKQMAINFCNKGEYQQGLLAFEASLQTNKNQPNIWRIVGRLQQDNDNDQAAIAAFFEALQIDQNDLNTLSVMGISCCNELNIEEAQNYLKSWIILKYNIEEPVDLITSFEQVLLQNQGDVDLHVSLGVLHFMQGSLKSLECFEQALNLEPQNYQLLNKIGAVLQGQNKIEESINKYEQALQFQPNCVRILVNFGIAYSQQQQFEKALEKYISALTICPQSTHIWEYIYQLLIMSDRMDIVNSINDHDLEKFKLDFQYKEKANVEPQISCIIIVQIIVRCRTK